MKKSNIWRKCGSVLVSLMLGVFVTLSVIPAGVFASQIPEAAGEEVIEQDLSKTESEEATEQDLPDAGDIPAEIEDIPESDGGAETDGSIEITAFDLPPELPEGVTGIEPMADASILAITISNYNGGGTGSLAAVESGNTVTVTGTITGVITGLTLELNSEVTVDWQATLSGSINPVGSISGYMLTLTGSGTFNVNSGAIINNGSGGAISVLGNTLNISGGTVDSPGSGFAIFNGVSTSVNSNAVINVNSGMVKAGNSSAIQANSAGTVVTVTGGTVTNAATSNINPTINMGFIPAPTSPSSLINVVVSGGLVQTTNLSNTSYVIQTAQNVTISGDAKVIAQAGRAINLIGNNSIATVEGNAEVFADSGIAISTATTNVNTVTNAQIIVKGGRVFTESGTAAIQTTGANGKVTVTGGQVSATSGVAVKATGSVAISGGFVFAYGTNIGQVVSAPNTNFPTGGVVAAWNNATLNPLYVERSANDLVILPANPASPPNSVYWHNSVGTINGIRYDSGNANGFFELPVTVSSLTSGTQGLIFDIDSGLFYIGSISNSNKYTDQDDKWEWNSGTLTLKGFSWSTTAPVALTITGGSNINIELDGSNTFVSTATAPGGAGILSRASISIAASTGTLNASASAGMGIDCDANNLTMNGGTVNAAAGNGTNTHGLNVGTLTVNGGALNASSGGPATAGAFFGINAAKLVVKDGDGVVTASGNSRAINSAALDLPNGYEYSKGTKADGSNASTFLVPNAAAYTYSANNSYVQIRALTPYELTVVNGVLGSGADFGLFYPGQTITITETIDPLVGSPYILKLGVIYPTQGNPGTYPPSIDVFKEWTSSDGGVFSAQAAGTTIFTMPDDNVTVTAVPQSAYKLWTSGAHIVNPQDLSLQRWQLGYYLPGTEVLLRSNASSSYNGSSIFDGWKEATIAPDGRTQIPGVGVFQDLYSSTTVYIMPDANAFVSAPWVSNPYGPTSPVHTLTVIGGTGALAAGPASGKVEYIRAGTGVRLVAAAPPEGYEFVCWSNKPTGTSFPGYQGAFIDINSPSTQFIMGEGDITVEAAYREKMYDLIVVNGKDVADEGPYKAGTLVDIKADPPPAMSEFTHWISALAPASAQIFTYAAVDFDDHQSDATTFTMPASHAVVTANYTKVLFELTVVDGLGSGEYRDGDQVVITASAPPGMVFDHWEVTRGGAVVDRVRNTDAVVTMPDGDVTVRAIFRNIAPPNIEEETEGSGSIVLEEEDPPGPDEGVTVSSRTNGAAGSPYTADGFHPVFWWVALAASLAIALRRVFLMLFR